MEYQLEFFIFLFIGYCIWAYTNLRLPLALASILIIFMGFLSMQFPQLFTTFFAPQSQASVFFTLSSLSTKGILFLLFVLLVPNRKFLFVLFAHLSIINAIYMLIRFFMHLQPYSMGLCSSVDAMLLAITYPYTLKYTLSTSSKITKFIYILLPPVTIFVAHGSIGIGGLCLGLAILLYSRANLKFLLVPIGLFIFAIFYKQHVVGHSLFNDSQRYVCWEWSMKFWWTNFNHWCGAGLGTYQSLGPFIQIQTHNMIGNWYIDMHNDWLQCLFELGYIGFLTVLSLVLYCVYKARHNRTLLASLLVYASSAFFYYPVHIPLLAVFGILLVKESLDQASY